MPSDREISGSVSSFRLVGEADFARVACLREPWYSRVAGGMMKVPFEKTPPLRHFFAEY
jgi:hypothetical protein